jgi:hypothetical protein
MVWPIMDARPRGKCYHTLIRGMGLTPDKSDNRTYEVALHFSG